MNKIAMYCVTDKILTYFNKLPYKFAGVGRNTIFPEKYLVPNFLDNIYNKEKYYSELTFQYWFWKNKLNKLKINTWLGFCQKRRFWIKKCSDFKKINKYNLNKNVLIYPPIAWKNYESVICESIFVNKVKKMKIIKRGFLSLIKNPRIFFNEKYRTVKLHFDMHHGYGNLDKAINVMDISDRNGFRNFINTSNSFNPNIMFVTKPLIADKWFNKLFPWLFRCEKIFGFDNLSGYDTTRLYAYLAERYLSFWFRKYTKFIEWPIVTLNKV
jgi:hypothetical protein